MSSRNKTILKVTDILELFVTHPRLSLNEMVRLSGRPKTSVHRIVGSLVEMGFLQKEPDGGYVLGLAFLQYGQLVADRLDIRREALPIMQRLRDETGEAVNLIVRVGDEAIYIEKVESPQPVRLYTQIGRRAPLYAGACPRILLAFLPPAERERYLAESELKPIARGTVTDRDRLRKLVRETLANGYTVSRSELEDDSTAVAAPVFDYSGPVAGLSLAGPDVRFPEERLPELAAKVVKAAQEISRRLGWKGGTEWLGG